jgi:drug/metabolite transporter (DMT)-like permease
VLAGPELTGGSAWSVAEVLLVSTCYAIAPLIAARYLSDVPALPLAAACLGVAAVVYALPAAATWPTEMPSTRVLLAIATLALICTALAFLVFFALIREVGPARALVFTYVNPAVALAAGVLILNEPITVWHLAGLALILTGSVLATRRSDAEPAAIPTP